MKKNLGAEEARRRLPELIERAHHGEAVVVTRRGAPYAAIVPIAEAARRGRGPSLLSLRGSGKGLWGETPGSAIDALRDEWE